MWPTRSGKRSQGRRPRVSVRRRRRLEPWSCGSKPRICAMDWWGLGRPQTASRPSAVRPLRTAPYCSRKKRASAGPFGERKGEVQKAAPVPKKELEPPRSTPSAAGKRGRLVTLSRTAASERLRGDAALASLGRRIPRDRGRSQPARSGLPRRPRRAKDCFGDLRVRYGCVQPTPS